MKKIATLGLILALTLVASCKKKFEDRHFDDRHFEGLPAGARVCGDESHIEFTCIVHGVAYACIADWEQHDDAVTNVCAPITRVSPRPFSEDPSPPTPPVDMLPTVTM